MLPRIRSRLSWQSQSLLLHIRLLLIWMIVFDAVSIVRFKQPLPTILGAPIESSGEEEGGGGAREEEGGGGGGGEKEEHSGENNQEKVKPYYQEQRRFNNEEEKVIDPWVDMIPKLLPTSVCEEIIAKSEEIGYALFEDSIDEGQEEQDNHRSQDIYLYDREKILHPELYDMVHPYLNTLEDVIRKRKDRVRGGSRGTRYNANDGDDDTSSTNEVENGNINNDLNDKNSKIFTNPSVDWIFLRKYYPNSARNSLRVHSDENMHSVNVALNDNYVGGGFFYIRPSIDFQEPRIVLDEEERYIQEKRDYNEVPDIPPYMITYAWLHNRLSPDVQRNSTYVHFPYMPQGSATLINYTVHHGVAPLSESSPVPRYALLLFYDMKAYARMMRRQDNTLVVDGDLDRDDGDDNEEDDKDDNDDEEEVAVLFLNQYNGNDKVDLYWIHPDTKERVLVHEGIDEKCGQVSSVGHEFIVQLNKSSRVLGRWTVPDPRKEGDDDVALDDDISIVIHDTDGDYINDDVVIFIRGADDMEQEDIGKEEDNDTPLHSVKDAHGFVASGEL